MTHTCPRCGSGETASRRQLFHILMDKTQPLAAFSWYGHGQPQALPPRSLLLMFLFLLAVLAVPASGFWLLERYPAVTWLLSAAALIVTFLVTDILLTYRRYQHWAGQWLCGDCRVVFAPSYSP